MMHVHMLRKRLLDNAVMGANHTVDCASSQGLHLTKSGAREQATSRQCAYGMTHEICVLVGGVGAFMWLGSRQDCNWLLLLPFPEPQRLNHTPSLI